MNKDLFYKNTAAINPHQLLIDAMQYVIEKRRALDLGAGALRDTKYLLECGFQHVDAVDLNQPIVLDDPRLTFFQEPFDTFEFKKGAYDLINFQYSLPFNSVGTFQEVWESTMSSLAPGGILVGNLFGERDEWNTPQSKLVFHTRDQIEALLSDIDVITLQEIEKESLTGLGKMKKWHLFNVIGRKSSTLE